MLAILKGNKLATIINETIIKTIISQEKNTFLKLVDEYLEFKLISSHSHFGINVSNNFKLVASC